MKTSTIDKLKEIISAMHRNIGRRCDGTDVNLCIDKMLEILDKETQRKEHKKDTINLLNVEINILKKRITEIENPKFQPIENTAHDEIYQRGFRDGENRSRQILLVKDSELVRLSELYDNLKKENLDLLTEIHNSKMSSSIFGFLNIALYGFSISSTGKVIINNGKEFKVLLDKLNEAYKDQCK